MIAQSKFATKIALLYIALLTVNACSASSLSANNISSTSNRCPQEPARQEKLDSNNVKLISLNRETAKESGQISSGKSLGYTFEGESGQKLNYKTKDDICIWLYTPDNHLVNSRVLPETGTYIIQLANYQGSKTFDLEISLDDPEQASSPPSSNATTASISQSQSVDKPVSEPTPNRPPADEFVRNYYLGLNKHDYSNTWSELSPNFQKLSVNGYPDYLQWWNSVDDIRIGNINLINQSSDTALVDAELYYVMNNGKVFEDYNKRIYLVWSGEKNSWLFERKLAP